jgi:hypothetical protein
MKAHDDENDYVTLDEFDLAVESMRTPDTVDTETTREKQTLYDRAERILARTKIPRETA